MMNLFLRLKHWQLFMLLMGIPFIGQIVTFFVVFTSSDPFAVFAIMPFIMIIFMTAFFCWFYSLGVNLHQKLPATVQTNLKRFKLFLFLPVIYILLMVTIGPFALSNISNPEADPSPFFVSFAIILPMHLFSMFCIFYCLRFIAKTMKAVEWQRQVSFSDYAGEFFLIWFFPIGVWFIQPRINELFKEKNKEKSEGFVDFAAPSL